MVARIIMAHDDMGGIGKEGTLPWPKNKEDLTWFKNNTTGGIVVMGGRTWDDPFMPAPLPNRVNMVARHRESSNWDSSEPVVVIKDFRKFVDTVNDLYGYRPLWFIGGASIFDQALEVVEELYLTHISGDYQCDTVISLPRITELFYLDSTDQRDGFSFNIWKRR